MITAVRLTLLLIRRTTDKITLLLPVAAFAVVTALSLTVVGGARFFFSLSDSDLGIMYPLLGSIAVILLVVPLITLCGAAARLSTRRRDDRLATLRLLGAPRRMITQVTVLEATGLALVGSVLGVLGHLALAPLTGLLHFHGEQLGFTRALVAPTVAALCVLGLVVMATVSALVGLRRVVVSPLGVRARQQATRFSAWRVIIFLAVLAVGVFAVGSLSSAFGAVGLIVVLGGAFGLAMAVLNLIGPPVVGAAARSRLNRSTKQPLAPGLLAARTVLDDPKAAWRQVSGVAMTSFMAVFGGVGVAISSMAAGHDSDPGMAAQNQMLATDILTGVLVTITISFVTVACAVAINAAAGVLDRRDQLRSLHQLGMPLRQVNASRRLAVRRPLVLVAAGSAIVAAIVVFPLTGIVLLVQPQTLLLVGSALVVGCALVLAAVRLTDGLVARVVTDPRSAVVA